jgi:hypothetical protein
MAAPPTGMREIPIDSLPVEKINELVQQTEKVSCLLYYNIFQACFRTHSNLHFQETNFFAESLKELREVQKKFKDSHEAVIGFSQAEEGHCALIPLAESVRWIIYGYSFNLSIKLYVPGRLCNTQKVLVEIGTGYYGELVYLFIIN